MPRDRAGRADDSRQPGLPPKFQEKTATRRHRNSLVLTTHGLDGSLARPGTGARFDPPGFQTRWDSSWGFGVWGPGAGLAAWGNRTFARAAMQIPSRGRAGNSSPKVRIMQWIDKALDSDSAATLDQPWVRKKSGPIVRKNLEFNVKKKS